MSLRGRVEARRHRAYEPCGTTSVRSSSAHGSPSSVAAQAGTSSASGCTPTRTWCDGYGCTPVDCATTHRVDYTANTVVVRVPRTCLREPRWVQGTMGVGTFSRGRVFADNPVDDGPTSRLPGYAPRIRRG